MWLFWKRFQPSSFLHICWSLVTLFISVQKESQLERNMNEPIEIKDEKWRFPLCWWLSGFVWVCVKRQLLSDHDQPLCYVMLVVLFRLLILDCRMLGLCFLCIITQSCCVIWFLVLVCFPLTTSLLCGRREEALDWVSGVEWVLRTVFVCVKIDNFHTAGLGGLCHWPYHV